MYKHRGKRKTPENTGVNIPTYFELLCLPEISLFFEDDQAFSAVAE
jgi:hypothetical protein